LDWLRTRNAVKVSGNLPGKSRQIRTQMAAIGSLWCILWGG